MPNAPRPDNPGRPIRIDDDLWAAAKATAAAQGTTVSAVVRTYLRRWVRQHADSTPPDTSTQV